VARYRIVPERSWVEIHARSSLHPIHTRTDGLEGDLDLDVLGRECVNLQATPRGTLTLRVERLSSGKPLEDRELRRRIDARKYPTIEGALTGLRETGTGGRYRVRGDLTFRGVTRSYEHEMTFVAPDGSSIELEGEATFDIRDFGMKPPRILMLTVEPEVRVKAHVVAETDG
jgi:polyisoprenoid-binding protein YceI